MNLLFWALTLGVIGKVMLGAGVLYAHSELAHERRVDQLVIKSFRIERILTLAGLCLIVTGYFLEISFYGVDTALLTCTGSECTAAIPSSISQP